MKNNILSTIIISSVVLFACTQKEKSNIAGQSVYEIAKVKEVVFPLDSSKNGKPLDYDVFYKRVYDYCFIDGIETLIIPINESRLAFYDLATKKEYHSVPLLQFRSIENFKYINKDSIFVFYEVKQLADNKYEPIYFQLLNYQGEIKVCDYKIDTSGFKDSVDVRTPFIVENDMHPIISNNNVYFLTEVSGINNIGTATFFKKQIPLFAYYNAVTKKITLSKSIKFPDISEGIYYDTHYRKVRYCLSEKNLPVLRFFYSSTLYEWDYKNDEVIRHSLKSKIIDSIAPLREENSLPESLEAVYGPIFYDHYNKIYYSFLYLNNVLYGNNYTILILADENFNYLGEIFNPPLGGNIEFSGDNIVLYGYYNDSIHVWYRKLVKTDKPLQPYLDSVKNELGIKRQTIESNYKSYKKNGNSLQAFLKSKFPQIEDDYVLLTLYASGGCPSCVDGIKKLLHDNYTVFKKLPFYMIYAGSPMEVSDIENYKNIEELNLIKDTLKVVQLIAINENKFNTLDPRLTVIKDNAVILDTVYNWTNIQTGLIPAMMENLDLK